MTDVAVPQSFAVAVDGPSGSGKSSAARGVANRLGWSYLDTGAMYRALTWWLLDKGVDVNDPVAVANSAHLPALEVSTDPNGPGVLVDGDDVTELIRDRHVTDAVSAVSAVPSVRARLVALQRAAMANGPVVIEGRDIGTVVAPDAPLKVFLVASSSARAERRNAELADRLADQLEDTLTSLKRRDLLDSTRDVSPLVKAADAVEIDSTELSLDQVIDAIADLVAVRLGERRSGAETGSS